MPKSDWALHTTKFVSSMDPFGSVKKEWIVHYIPFSWVATFRLPEHARLFVEAMEALSPEEIKRREALTLEIVEEIIKEEKHGTTKT